jgi:hypothetical protein
VVHAHAQVGFSICVFFFFNTKTLLLTLGADMFLLQQRFDFFLNIIFGFQLRFKLSPMRFRFIDLN